MGLRVVTLLAAHINTFISNVTEIYICTCKIIYLFDIL